MFRQFQPGLLDHSRTADHVSVPPRSTSAHRPGERGADEQGKHPPPPPRPPPPPPPPPPPHPHLLLLAQYIMHSYNYTSYFFVRFQVPKLPNTTMDSLLTITQSLRMSTDPTVSIAGMHAEEGGFGIPPLCICSIYMYTCTKMYVQPLMLNMFNVD